MPKKGSTFTQKGPRRIVTWGKNPPKVGERLTDRAWAAGIIDGEGSFGCATISVKGRWRYPQLRLQVSQRSDSGNPPEMLIRLSEIFGGKIVGPYHPSKGSFAKGPVYKWDANGIIRVQSILAVVWPWLGEIKRQQYIRSLNSYLPYYRAKMGVTS